MAEEKGHATRVFFCPHSHGACFCAFGVSCFVGANDTKLWIIINNLTQVRAAATSRLLLLRGGWAASSRCLLFAGSPRRHFVGSLHCRLLFAFQTGPAELLGRTARSRKALHGPISKVCEGFGLRRLAQECFLGCGGLARLLKSLPWARGGPPNVGFGWF